MTSLVKTPTLRYSLEEVHRILFDGFDYVLPSDTLSTISNIAQEVGAPDYVKTPMFQKRENPMKPTSSGSDAAAAGVPFSPPSKGHGRNKRNHKAAEVVNDADWEAIRSFQATKMEEKVGIEAKVDQVRALLNKLTDKNYMDIQQKVCELVVSLQAEGSEEDLSRISSVVFDIASANRFYSKIYADLYSELSTKYSFMLGAFAKNFDAFLGLFENIVYVDSKVNYDLFCEMNRTNERRKALASFYCNLMNNGIIEKSRIRDILYRLVAKMYEYLSLEDKKNEVDEMTETIALMYTKELFADVDEEEEKLVEGFTVTEVIEKIAGSKVKDYKSLTNKSLFKFMDLVEI